MKINTRSITLAATLAALCAVTGAIPYVFFLPVMVAATTLSVGMVAFVGLAFGCISVAYSFMMPSSFVALAFVEAPYIAIVPRILAALGAFGIYKLIVKLAKPKSRVGSAVSCAVAAATGSLFNTGLVVGSLILLKPELLLGGVTLIELFISGAIECACMALLTPPVSLTLDKVVFHRKKQDKSAKEDKSETEQGEPTGLTEVSTDESKICTDGKKPAGDLKSHTQS